MEEHNKEQEVVENTDASDSQDTSSQPAGVDTTTPSANTERGARGGARRNFGSKKPGFRKGSPSRFRSERPKPEFEQKIINISRVTRVVKGGRRLSFRVDMVIGDNKGRVGLGSGKATDTSLAIQKAFAQARKHLIKIKRTENNSIPFAVDAKVTSSRIEMMPNHGRGLVAGSTMRTVLELAGITDVSARVHSRSKNKLNNAKAALKALKVFSVPMEPLKDEPKDTRQKGRFGNRSDRPGARKPRASVSSNQ
ncbi:30S ribosomal protein S5 [Patescibacteria group bacterium]|nr:30S ribosomal protein S5 [Patescibacteria group bacterium]